MTKKNISQTIETEEQKIEKHKRFELRTRGGYRLDEVSSALQKSIRRCDELMATYWSFELNESGYWRYCFRRLQVVAGEDCGLANPEAMILVSSTYSSLLAQDRVKKITQVDNNILGFVVAYLARSKKSRLIDMLGGVIFKKKERGWKPEIPDVALDMHCERGRAMGRGEDHFFSVGSRIVNKKWVEGEEKITKLCLELYGYKKKRDESQF